ncbi:MNN10 [Symbiodinium natans]|uniref:MNN10 protein n=1 Tax=Symbiodinium natans TaxID=878477 RepID=A0A812M562_9DINO|nr:MNN10 [Symbiodinium natans]
MDSPSSPKKVLVKDLCPDAADAHSGGSEPKKLPQKLQMPPIPMTPSPSQSPTKKMNFLFSQEMKSELATSIRSIFQKWDPGYEVTDYLKERAVQVEEADNPGSLGHPQLCRRRCIYFAKGHCQHGSSCGFCHLEHTRQPAQLDKKQRTIFDKLTEGQKLEILLPHLRAKATEEQLQHKADSVVQIMERRMHEVSPGAPALPEELTDSRMSNLDKVFARMTFAGLVGLSFRKTVDESDYVVSVLDALERLRVKYAATSPRSESTEDASALYA